MHCYICDRLLEEPVYNQELEIWEACPSCLLAIEDAVGTRHLDRPSAPEDAWSEEPLDVLVEDEERKHPEEDE